MKFLVVASKYEDLKNVTRHFGYAAIFDKRSGQESFVRRLGDGYYPRFHLYLEEKGANVAFSLHLDQKKASYQDQHMHSAEYDGDLVENEINDLKTFVANNGFNINFNNSMEANKEELPDSSKQADDHGHEPEFRAEDVLNNLEAGDLDRDLNNFQKNKVKKSFFTIF
ncbi:hypothetical protein CVU82_01640 [Candidatus Falkowbacteria bacterium HGW-Falkowbacteria-1]|jgi:hypothetical protein|uniref:Uncharacterized protein n=1 Tax=Candidatus Falkowbacteria bacterium HGW-Falkowbacteria-1 TaxID=2013768 RepID=A0A2N2E972_9BACT|nr:MAG: hypothetical protein CVU82_01640 [Candidatus Falkowbacteria bacterium HGW-Falkowbacteria-1]